MEVPLQIHDGTVSLLPDMFLVKQLLRKSLSKENLRMYTCDEHFLAVRTIEDADLSALWKPGVDPVFETTG
jgi:hypothetical protein